MRRIKRIGETFLHLDDYLLRFLFEFLEGRECLAMELCLNRRLYNLEYYACKIDYDEYDKKHEKTIVMKKGEMWWSYWEKRKVIPLKLTSRRCDKQVWTTVRYTYSINAPDYQERKIITFMNMSTRGATRRVIKLLRDGKLNLWDEYYCGEINLYTTLRRGVYKK
tara:strand:+ start:103 stop:597 length:495 start_codon:yes stop_codon:yes gene_type:complete